MDTIRSGIISYFKKTDLKKLGIVNGNTQVAERNLIDHLEKLFTELNVTYTKAGSQQPKDFRNINNTDKHIEVKIVTNKFKIIFNDTLPCLDTEYLIFFTGKLYKKQEYKPQILLVNGEQFVKESREWVDEVSKILTDLKDKYCRGNNKKELCGIMNCYLRPTWSSSIFSFLDRPEFIVYKSN